jgi:hypothetical protein
MTREEILKMAYAKRKDTAREEREFLNAVIKALEQEPCEDANANQHTSNALNDVGQHANALEDYAESEE